MADDSSVAKQVREEREDVALQLDTDSVHIFSSNKNANVFISEHEAITSTKYTHQKTNVDAHGSGCKIHWEDSDVDRLGPLIEYDGIPFIILGDEVRECQYWRDQHQNIKVPDCHTEHNYGSPRKSHISLECPAKIRIRKILKFPQFKIAGPEKSWTRARLMEKLSQKITCATTVKEYRVYVRLPDDGDHVHKQPTTDAMNKQLGEIPRTTLMNSLPQELLAAMMEDREEAGSAAEVVQGQVDVVEEMIDDVVYMEVEDDKVEQEGNRILKSQVKLAPRSTAVVKTGRSMGRKTVVIPAVVTAGPFIGTKAVTTPAVKKTEPVMCTKTVAIPKVVKTEPIFGSKYVTTLAGAKSVGNLVSPIHTINTKDGPIGSSSTQRVFLQTLPTLESQSPRIVVLDTGPTSTAQTAGSTPKKPPVSKPVPAPCALPAARSPSPPPMPMTIEPWKGIVGSVAISDTCFYVDNLETLQQCIKRYEEDTFSIFVQRKQTTKAVREIEEVPDLGKHHLRWVPMNPKWKPADYVADNIPYIVIGHEHLSCRFHKPYQKKTKIKPWCVICNKTQEEQQTCTDPCTCRVRDSLKHSKKGDCTATIRVQTVMRFPDFKEMRQSHRQKDEMTNNLKVAFKLAREKNMKLRQEKRIYVTIPKLSDHRNHAIFQVAMLETTCCPCYRTGTCGGCSCKKTGCSGCNNNQCRFRDLQGNFGPKREIKKRKKRKSPYAAKSIRNYRMNPDELTLNEELERETEMDRVHEQQVVLKIQCEINQMTADHMKTALMQMVEDNPFQVEAYVTPDHAPYHRVLIHQPPSWCSCTQCVQMDNRHMRVCCGFKPCLSFDATFRSVCLRPDHLLMSILDLSTSSDNIEIGYISNAKYRRQAYRYFILWQWNNLGKGGIEVPKPPSCVVARIRWRYPSIDNQYSATLSPDSDFEEENN